MKKIMILDEQEYKGIGEDWAKQGEDVFLLQPYNTIKCLKSDKAYTGGSSVVDFVKYILSSQASC